MAANEPAATVPIAGITPSRDKESIWYSSKLQDMSPAARELLEKYSHIPPESVENHIYAVVS